MFPQWTLGNSSILPFICAILPGTREPVVFSVPPLNKPELLPVHMSTGWVESPLIPSIWRSWPSLTCVAFPRTAIPATSWFGRSRLDGLESAWINPQLVTWNTKRYQILMSPVHQTPLLRHPSVMFFFSPFCVLLWSAALAPLAWALAPGPAPRLGPGRLPGGTRKDICDPNLLYSQPYHSLRGS